VRRIFKKINIIFIVILALTMSIGVLSGCEHRAVIVGYFRVLDRGDNLRIVGFSSLGRMQEVIKIPAEINGRVVDTIGRWTPDIVLNEGTGFESERLRKMYLSPSVWVATTFYLSSSEIEKIVDLHVSAYWFENRIKRNNSFIVNPYTVGDNVLRPNIIYFYNYHEAPNQGYFWFDHITESSIYLRPPLPTRQGYVFQGWYLEPQGVTQWNSQMPRSADEKIRLYAKWQSE